MHNIYKTLLIFIVVASSNHLSRVRGNNNVIDYFTRCGQWLTSNGEDCDNLRSRAAPPFTFSFGANYSAPPVSVSDQICCPDGTGCFSIQSGSAFDCHLHLPRCMHELEPHFLFYTPDRSQQVSYVFHSDTSMPGDRKVEKLKPYYFFDKMKNFLMIFSKNELQILFINS